MYSYKLNNSYTVYVNYIYLNECIKASKEWEKSHKLYEKYNDEKEIIIMPEKEKRVFAPLPKYTKLIHKVFGLGKVVSIENGVMQVAFSNKVTSFVYPDAINQGYLSKV